MIPLIYILYSILFILIFNTVNYREEKGLGIKDVIVRTVPVSICGLSLGLVSLDRFLWYVYRDIYVFNIFAVLALITTALFTLRLMFDFKGVIRAMQAPSVFAIMPTYLMTLMHLFAYAADHPGGLARDLVFLPWLGTIAACYILMFIFTKKFLLNFRMENVFPSWTVVFVGYVTASVTSASFGMEQLGQIIFWSGLICYLGIMPLIVYRTLIVRKIPEPLVASVAIFPSPINQCVVGCIIAFGAPAGAAGGALILAAVLGTVSYVLVVGYLPIMLNRKFHSSFSCLTFPLVISAVAFYRLGEFYDLLSNGIFKALQMGTLVIAVCIVVYVLMGYVMLLYREIRDMVTEPSRADGPGVPVAAALPVLGTAVECVTLLAGPELLRVQPSEHDRCGDGTGRIGDDEVQR